MNIWDIHYVNMQPTSIPNCCEETTASPDAASSIARNGFWPARTFAFPIIEVPVDGRIEKPTDAPECLMTRI